MTNATTSLSTLLSLSDTLKTLPTQRSSQVSNETKAIPSPLQNGGQAGHYGPAFVLDISAKGLAIINGDNTPNNGQGSLQLAASNDAINYTRADAGASFASSATDIA